MCMVVVVFGGRHRPTPVFYKVMMISRARRGMSEVVRIEDTTTKKPTTTVANVGSITAVKMKKGFVKL